MDTAITLEQNNSNRPFDGWILYTNGDSSLNMHYVDLYRRACQKRGMSIGLGFYHPDFAGSGDSRQTEGVLAAHKPLYVINRTRDYRLAQFFESKGIPVFNHSSLTRLGNDKSEAYRYMQRLGIPVMPTLYHTNMPPQWYPAVVKSSDGHGGTEVFFIRDEAAWKNWKKQQGQNPEEDEGNRKRYIVQQAASGLGKDVRVYIVGNRITAAVLRTSKSDFRSNYCLGGQVELYRLSGRERELVQRAIEGLSIGMAGIDFIFHKGEMVFNEMEDMVGARGLYSLADYDIVDDYISYIQEELPNAANTSRKTENL